MPASIGSNGSCGDGGGVIGGGGGAGRLGSLTFGTAARPIAGSALRCCGTAAGMSNNVSICGAPARRSSPGWKRLITPYSPS